jgi:hypothetical protein
MGVHNIVVGVVPEIGDNRVVVVAAFSPINALIEMISF